MMGNFPCTILKFKFKKFYNTHLMPIEVHVWHLEDNKLTNHKKKIGHQLRFFSWGRGMSKGNYFFLTNFHGKLTLIKEEKLREGLYRLHQLPDPIMLHMIKCLN